MRFLPLLRLIVSLACLLALIGSGGADPVIPGNILDPKSPAEAWNVIRLVAKNVEQLVGENRLPEVPVQISYSSPALRALPKMVTNPETTAALEAQVSRAFTSVNAIATAAQQDNVQGAKQALSSLQSILEEMAPSFDAKAVRADIFFCPMHADFLAEQAKTPCGKCGMDLLARRIPYSFIYTKPGEPSIRLTARASGPIEAGKKIEVKVRLEQADQSPVRHADLLEMHTQPIHLLIEEPGLADYHHEHPVATEIPGEYSFTFSPRKTSPYRIWADIVPAATGVQELPFVDLPSGGKAGAIEDMATRLTAVAGDYRFALTFNEQSHLPPQAGQARKMTIAIKDANGLPVRSLEPVMNAFAHLVGFYEDYQTVVHLHPTGGDVLDSDLRGGPSLGFIFFAPKAGFVRLYCQVSIGGKMLFAPFNLNVAP